MKNEIKEDIKKFINDLKKGDFKAQLPNILTASRLLSPFFLIPLIYYDKLILAFIMVIIFSLTDTFDGYFARKYHNITLFGKYLDAVVDKIFALSLLIPVILKSQMDSNNQNLIYINIILEIIIGSFNLYSFFNNLKPSSTFTGKIKTVFLFCLLGLLYLNKLIYIKSEYLMILILVTIIFQFGTIISYFNQIKKRKLLLNSSL